MKLEKREITLNEQDSVQDMLTMEKSILRAYADTVEHAFRKENRNCLCQHLQQTANEIFLLKDKLTSLQENAVW